MNCVFIAVLPAFEPSPARITTLLDLLASASLGDFGLSTFDDDELVKQKMLDASDLLRLYPNLKDREQAEKVTQPLSYPVWVTGGFQSEAPELYQMFSAVPASVVERMALFALQDIYYSAWH